MKRRYGDIHLYRRLLGEARSHLWHILGVVALSLLAVPLTLLRPVPMKLAIDNVIGNLPLPPALATALPSWAASSDVALLIFVAGLIVIVALLQQGLGMTTMLLQTYTGSHLTMRFRARLLQHAEILSLTYHDTRGVTDSLYRIQQDGTAVSSVILASMIPLISQVITLVSMFIVVTRIDWVLTIVALVVGPLMFAATNVFRPRLREQWKGVRVAESSALEVVQESLSILRVVKAFGQEKREEERFRSRARRGIGALMHAAKNESILGMALGMITACGMAAVLFIGVYHVQIGRITLGDLVLVNTYAIMLYQPLQAISMQLGVIQNALASAERAYTLLDEPPEATDRSDSRPLARAAGSIEMRGVTFSYNGGGLPTLQEVSFTVPAGIRVGIAGETGSGKTTLVNLLPRFYDPSAGSILLDGVDVRDYRLEDLRRQFAIVLQEPVLFSTSIAENIAYGRPEATMEEIVEAAKAANAHDFIMRMPEGYQAEVGERGMRLSGGERQRITLARAFLRDAPILILDEPTSSIDVGTEALVLDAMQRLMSGRTTFIIAHRLNTLEGCDRKLVLKGGQLVRVEHLTPTLLSAAEEQSGPHARSNSISEVGDTGAVGTGESRPTGRYTTL